MKIKVNAAKRKSEEVFINTEFIRLDSFLKFKGIAETGGQAKQFIHCNGPASQGFTGQGVGVAVLDTGYRVIIVPG